MDNELIYYLAALPWEWFWITVSFIIAVACGWNIGHDHAIHMKPYLVKEIKMQAATMIKQADGSTVTVQQQGCDIKTIIIKSEDGSSTSIDIHGHGTAAMIAAALLGPRSEDTIHPCQRRR